MVSDIDGVVLKQFKHKESGGVCNCFKEMELNG